MTDSERLARIEGKLDLALAAAAADRIETEKAKNDITWLKGGMTIVMSIILGVSGWLATQYLTPPP